MAFLYNNSKILETFVTEYPMIVSKSINSLEINLKGTPEPHIKNTAERYQDDLSKWIEKHQVMKTLSQYPQMNAKLLSN